MSQDAKTKLRETRIAAKQIEADLQLRQLQSVQKRTQRIAESSDQWDYLNAYADLVDRLRSTDGGLYLPISTATDRMYGANYPFWRSWQEHGRLRGMSRLLAGMSFQCQGALGGLTSYVVGKGMSYRFHARAGVKVDKELVAAANDVAESFAERNQFDLLEMELFQRGRRDGEFFLRGFAEEDALEVRTVEPEYVIEDAGVLEKETGTNPKQGEFSFGIVNPVDDIQKPTGFITSYTGSSSDAEIVPATEMVHFKVGVDRAIKRGMPDFVFGTYDAMMTTARSLENMAEGVAIQASIAMIRQHDNAQPGAIQSFVDGMADYQRNEPISGKSTSFTRARSGTVQDIPRGMTYVTPPFGQSTPQFSAVIQMVMRCLGVKWNAPEWLLSGDASNNNYSSSITAESPFVKRCQQMQHQHCKPLVPFFWWALRVYCEARGGLRVNGVRIPYETVKRLLKLQVEAPTSEVRNKLEEANANQVRILNGWKDRQTVAQEEGLDWDQVQQNNEEYLRSRPQPSPLPMPGDNGPPNDEPPKPPQDDPSAPPKPAAAEPARESHGPPAWASALTERLQRLETLLEDSEPKHKGKGPGGGQFTSSGGGGSGGEKLKKTAAKAKEPAEKTNKSGVETATPEAHKAAIQKAIAKAKDAPAPSAEDIEKARVGIAEMGANKYRKGFVGNSTDRAARRKKLQQEFGDGEKCPCIYCGLMVGDAIGEGTLEQDKIYTTAVGGRYKTSNLVPSCGSCNKQRSDKSFGSFMKEVGHV